MNKFLITFAGLILIITAFIFGKFSQSDNARYQIFMHPTFRADQYLLDTKTGHVWHLVEDQKDKMLIWEPMLKSNPTIEELTSDNTQE